MTEEVALNRPERGSIVLANVMHLLQELEQKARASTDASFQDRVITRLREHIPEEMRRVLDKHLRITKRRLQKRFMPEKATRIFREIQSRRTRSIHSENLYDSILSTPEHPIHAKGFGISLLNRHLGTMATDKSPDELLRTYGWVSLDMNGVKGMVDCTTYGNVTRYLQAVAQFLLDRNGKTRQWLEGQKIKVIPQTAGGDEFALLLDGESPMTPGFFREVAVRYQAELVERQELRRFLNFKERKVQLEFMLPNEDQRTLFFRMTDEQKDEYLKVPREELPDDFIPTWGIGGATLSEGVLRSVERGSLSFRSGKETFDSVRLKMIRHTMEIAEERQAEDKAKFKCSLEQENPKLLRFFLRNGENRKLDERLRDTELRLNEALAALEQTNSEKTELRTQLDEANAREIDLAAQVVYWADNFRRAMGATEV